MSLKLTNSHANRKIDSIAAKQYSRDLKKVRDFETGQVESTEIYSQEFLDIAIQLGENPHFSEEEKQNIIFNMLNSGKVKLFTEDYTKVLEDSIFGGFSLLILMLATTIIENLSLLPLFEEKITENLSSTIKKNPSILDLQKGRAAAKNLTFFMALSVKRKVIDLSTAQLCLSFNDIWIDAIDVQENIASKRVVYVDDYLAVTWYSACVEDSKNFSPGQVGIAVRSPSGLWTFDKHLGTNIPVSSLRKARTACIGWRGHSMKGQITHPEAERIAKFLGFKVEGKIAYLGTTRSKGFGKGFGKA